MLICMKKYVFNVIFNPYSLVNHAKDLPMASPHSTPSSTNQFSLEGVGLGWADL